MNENVLNRTENKINRDDYIRIFKLHRAYEWLTNEPEAFFDLWCMCDSEEQKELIEKLIVNFLHLTSRDLLTTGKVISNLITDDWKLSHVNTYFVATSDDDKPDGSQAFIQLIKNKFSQDWKERNFFNNLLDGAHKIQNNSIIVLVDDFIGTGNTIKRKLDYLINKLKQRKIKNFEIKIISIAAMNFSKEVLDSLNVEYFSHYWLKKGINECLSEEEIPNSTKSMEELEGKLLEKYNNRYLPKFGYKRSESLFAIEAQNIPNNVFPIFWWPYLKRNEKRLTIFKRL